MKKILLSLFFIVSLSLLSKGQQANSDLTSVQTDLKKITGTYQIQIRGDLREPFSLPDNIYNIVQENRSSDKIVYYTLLENKVRIMILPEKQIKAIDFKAIPVQNIIHNFDKKD